MLKEEGGRSGTLKSLGALHVHWEERVCVTQPSRMLFNQCDGLEEAGRAGLMEGERDITLHFGTFDFLQFC